MKSLSTIFILFSFPAGIAFAIVTTIAWDIISSQDWGW